MTVYRISYRLCFGFAAAVGVIGCMSGRAPTPARTAAQTSAQSAAERRVVCAPRAPESDAVDRVAVVLDGKVLGEETSNAPRPPALARLDALPPDSIFETRIVSDSAGLAVFGLCPGVPAFVLTTTAEARRLGLRAPPPALCLRTSAGRSLPRKSFTVDAEFQFRAGQLDILGECDRAAPAGVSWMSTTPSVATIDSVGRVRARSPGTTEVVVRAGGAEARFGITVVPTVARIAIIPADTVISVGDTVRFRAVPLGTDGRPVGGAIVELRVSEVREANTVDAASGMPRRPGISELYSIGPNATRSVPNEQPVRATRAAVGYVIASVVGRMDSVRVRAIDR